MRPAIFVEAHFKTGIGRFWSGSGTITWNGSSWAGVGTMGSISTIEEGSNIEARGMTLTLSGLDVSLLTYILDDYQLALPVVVWLGLFDASHALIANPVVCFAGRMDQPVIDVSGETASVAISCENRLLDMNTSVERRYTHEDQQLDYPGDLGMEFVNSIQDVTIYWGKTPSSHNNL
jgi:hypothetical protein